MIEYFVIFGGGGIRGISYCGAYKALTDCGIKTTGLAGSSVGAVFAVLLCLNYTYQEIFEILSETGLNLFNDLNFDIKKDFAFSKGNKFYDWIKNHIESKFYGDGYIKGNMPPVKFSDIKQPLVVYAVDLASMKFKEFSNVLTPDVELAYAVRASVSMPGLFTPLIDDKNEYLVDGDLLKSSPLWRVSDTIKNIDSRIIEFRLEDTKAKNNISNSIDYVNRVYNAFCGFATDYIIDLYGNRDKFDYVKIITPNVSVADFLLPKTKRQELFEIGYNTTIDYIKNKLKNKRLDLVIKYKKLLDIILNFQKKFIKGDYCSSYICLCELFVCLCEEKRYIDTKIYDYFIELKDLYFQNYVKSSIFNFNRGRIKDKKDEIYKFILFVIKVLTNRIEELN